MNTNKQATKQPRAQTLLLSIIINALALTRELRTELRNYYFLTERNERNERMRAQRDQLLRVFIIIIHLFTHLHLILPQSFCASHLLLDRNNYKWSKKEDKGRGIDPVVRG